MKLSTTVPSLALLLSLGSCCTESITLGAPLNSSLFVPVQPTVTIRFYECLDDLPAEERERIGKVKDHLAQLYDELRSGDISRAEYNELSSAGVELIELLARQNYDKADPARSGDQTAINEALAAARLKYGVEGTSNQALLDAVLSRMKAALTKAQSGTGKVIVD